MWTSRLKDVRSRRNRWQLEGDFQGLDGSDRSSFSLNVRFGWLSMECRSGPVFDRVLKHFVEVLGQPKEPPTCAGSSECQDDAVHLTTSWELPQTEEAVSKMIATLLKVDEAKLLADTHD